MGRGSGARRCEGTLPARFHWAKLHLTQEGLHFHAHFFGEFQMSSRCLAGPVNPGRKRGPWRIICDNESFAFAPDSAKAHKQANVKLLRIPAKVAGSKSGGAFLVLGPEGLGPHGP